MSDNESMWGGGNWFIVLILFFLGFGGGGFGFGNAGMNGALTRAELHEALNSQEIQGAVNGLRGDMNNAFFTENTAMLTGFNSLQQGINNGFAGVQAGLCNGFNSVNSNLAGLSSQMAACCCETRQAIHAEGEATRALIQQNTIQDLRDRLEEKDRDLLKAAFITSQVDQTGNLQNFIRSMVNGCGGYGYGY